MQANRKSQIAAVCGAQSNGVTCMETKSLAIVHEFNKIYEDQIEQINRMSGDNIEVYCSGWYSTQIFSFFFVLFLVWFSWNIQCTATGCLN